MKNEYYVIANVDKEGSQSPHSSFWPKMIGFSFENMSLLFLEGRGHGLQGGEIKIDQFEPKQWKDFFIDADSEWFLDFVSKREILSAGAEQKLIEKLKQHSSIQKIEY